MTHRTTHSDETKAHGMASEIRNRIVEIKRIRFSEVQPHSRNPKRHPANQRAAFRGSVAELGFASVPIAYRNADGVLVWADGHLRGSEVADYEGDVAITDFTDEEVNKFLLYADPIAAMAEYESQQLDSLLRDVQTGDEALQAMLAGLAEDAGLYPDKPAVNDVPPQIDKAEELGQKWGVESGDLWILGQHRLICGDCTDKATVDRLMGGEKAALTFTDPPYNVAQNMSKHLFANTNGNAHKVLEKSDWDKGFDPSLAFVNIQSVLADDCTVYVCTSHWLAGQVWQWMAEWADVFNYCVWCKPNPMPSLQMRHWTFATELICYATRGKHHFDFPKGEHLHSYWLINKLAANENHPTEKPVDVPANAIQHSSKQGDIVFDGFLGSGTTLIACEQLGRKCRAVEISPAYCAVALERWSLATNAQPVRVEA